MIPLSAAAIVPMNRAVRTHVKPTAAHARQIVEHVKPAKHVTHVTPTATKEHVTQPAYGNYVRVECSGIGHFIVVECIDRLNRMHRI